MKKGAIRLQFGKKEIELYSFLVAQSKESGLPLTSYCKMILKKQFNEINKSLIKDADKK